MSCLMYLTHWILNRKETLAECLVKWVSYYLWVLSWVHNTSSDSSSPLILEYPLLQVVWQLLTIHKLSLISPSFLFFTMRHFHSLLWVCVLLFPFSVFILFSFPFMLVNSCTSSSSSSPPYIVFFSLPSISEPSHLLNHLVKFVSSGNLLWVCHHNC